MTLAIACLAVAGRAAAGQDAAPAATGEVFIAGFRNDDPGGPNMDLVGPGPGSTYSFRFDEKTDVGVKQGERRRVSGLPGDRKFLVELRLDGQRTEAFWLDLRKQDGGKACLWLYQGYWHWSVTSWDDRSKGCRCGDEAPRADGA